MPGEKTKSIDEPQKMLTVDKAEGLGVDGDDQGVVEELGSKVLLQSDFDGKDFLLFNGVTECILSRLSESRRSDVRKGIAIDFTQNGIDFQLILSESNDAELSGDWVSFVSKFDLGGPGSIVLKLGWDIAREVPVLLLEKQQSPEDLKLLFAKKLNHSDLGGLYMVRDAANELVKIVNAADYKVVDSEGNEYTFSNVKNNRVGGDWVKFVMNSGLKLGDSVLFYWSPLNKLVHVRAEFQKSGSVDYRNFKHLFSHTLKHPDLSDKAVLNLGKVNAEILSKAVGGCHSIQLYDIDNNGWDITFNDWKLRRQWRKYHLHFDLKPGNVLEFWKNYLTSKVYMICADNSAATNKDQAINDEENRLTKQKIMDVCRDLGIQVHGVINEVELSSRFKEFLDSILLPPKQKRTKKKPAEQTQDETKAEEQTAFEEVFKETKVAETEAPEQGQIEGEEKS